MNKNSELNNYFRINSELINKNEESKIDSFCVWTYKSPNVNLYPDIVFFKCRVLSIDGDNYNVREIIPETNSEYTVKKQNLYNCNDNVNVHSHRLNDLIHQNSAEVLNTLDLRYKKNYIYTIAEPILISINPYQIIDVNIDEYRHMKTDQLPPHVYTYAKEALLDYISTNRNQSMIISGESGSGKTEASKLVIKYYLTGSTQVNDISKTLWDSNLILEAFGNAKTIKNNNSSRYGKFIKIKLDKNHNIISSCIEIFLLEKIRVVSQEEEERCYHIFYQILKGMSNDLKNKYKIKPESEYNYFSNKGITVPDLNDIEDFENLHRALDKMKMSYLKDDLFFTLSGLLLLGNIEFDSIEKGGKTNCSIINDNILKIVSSVCDLLGLEYDYMRKCLIETEKVIANQKIEIPFSIDESISICKSMSKDIYNKIFEYLTKKINEFLNGNQELDSYIGILDIFGFEIFKKNSLEQLLINIANEEIHNIYLFVVYERESNLYKSEGILSESVKYTTNDSVLDLLQGKTSIISILEDACLSPGKKDESIVQIYGNKFGKHTQYSICRLDIRYSFLIKHTVSDVVYNISGFISKNKDILSSNILNLLKVSKNNLIKDLYADVQPTESLGRKNLVTYKYLDNLRKISANLKETNIFFIKCIKPNETKEKNNFNQKKIFPQLFALSIIETLNIQFFFQYKYTFASFINYYKYLDVSVLDNPGSDDKTKVTTALKNTLNDDLFKIGNTMVFLKKEAIQEIRTIINNNLKCYVDICNIISAFTLKTKKNNLIESKIKNLEMAQAYFRKYKYINQLK
ncbi:myosin B, putative [Hepatocystis sp. ex Piliocolobus tephrosceles]|nr:myosin B, putative [Hepatocystis sp. ex Piliocolobus tephrosceles]